MNKVILSTLILLLAVQGLNAGLISFIFNLTLSIIGFVFFVISSVWNSVFYGSYYNYGAISSSGGLSVLQGNLWSAHNRLISANSFIRTQAVSNAQSWSSLLVSLYSTRNISFNANFYGESILSHYNQSYDCINWGLASVGLNFIGRCNNDRNPCSSFSSCSLPFTANNDTTNCTSAPLLTQALQFNASADILIEAIRQASFRYESYNNQSLANCSCPLSANGEYVASLWLDLKAAVTASINLTSSNCSLLVNVNSTLGTNITFAYNETWNLLLSANNCSSCIFNSTINDGVRTIDICSSSGERSLFRSYSDGKKCSSRNRESFKNIRKIFRNHWHDRVKRWRSVAYATYVVLNETVYDVRVQLRNACDKYKSHVVTYTVTSIKNSCSNVNASLYNLYAVINVSMTNLTSAINNYYESAQANASAYYINATDSVNASAEAFAGIVLQSNNCECTFYANVSAEAFVNYTNAAVGCASAAEERYKEINANASVLISNLTNTFQYHVNCTDAVYAKRCSPTDYKNSLSPYYGARCVNNVVVFNSLWGGSLITATSAEFNTVNVNINANITLIYSQVTQVITYLVNSYASVAQDYQTCIANNATLALGAIAEAQIGFEGCVNSTTTTTVAPTQAPTEAPTPAP